MKTRYSNSRSKKWILLIIVLLIGIGLGKMIFGAGKSKSITATELHTESTNKHDKAVQLWTCAMHPQVRETHSGKCPICGMDLIPVEQIKNTDHKSNNDSLIGMSDEAIALTNIETSKVNYSTVRKKIRLYGTVKADEQLTQTQTAHVSGRIERLYIDFTGQSVHKGQTIATVYSPELLNAQQELLEAKKWVQNQPELLQAARQKLILLKLTPSQIDAIEQSGKTSPLMAIKATTDGIVVAKNIQAGDYISQGQALFTIANLAKVWVLFDAYESDLPFIHEGNAVSFATDALPEQQFRGKVSFIDRTLNGQTRTAKVRVEIANGNRKLKPEMYATATIEAGENETKKALTIPKSAVLWTGKRSVVYVEAANQEGAFEMRKVGLGLDLGDSYVVLSGLKAGESVVTQGAFAIDAGAQLDGKPSMMNQTEKVSQIQSSMPGMDMPGMKMN